MDYETVSPEAFGASLRGLGLNLLVRDVAEQVAFLTSVFGMTAHRISADFAIMRYGDHVFQIHEESTYHAHPLPGLLLENPPRGAGIEIRLFDSDPDHACAAMKGTGGTVLQPPTDKPHGLREAYLLGPDGYCWVPSRAL